VRACFLVNKRILKARWTATYHSPDLSTLTFSPSGRDGETLHVHNLYNPTTDTGQSTIPILRKVFTRSACDIYIKIGDFNLHHPLWGGERDPRRDNESEELFQLIGEYQMELLLPPGSITFDERGRQTTIDLIFGILWVQQRRIFCEVRKDLDHQSDHLPVVTTIMTEVEVCKPAEQRQWQRTNQDIFRHILKRVLPLPTPLSSEEEIDRRVQELVTAITKAIKASTPVARPSTKSISGWTQECKDAQMTAR
jgi:Endonuclease-reverse transcriptase